MCVESVTKYIALSTGQLTVAGCLYRAGFSGWATEAKADFSTIQLLVDLVLIAPFFAFAFCLFEKINKERFVINQTNQQTRKL